MAEWFAQLIGFISENRAPLVTVAVALLTLGWMLQPSSEERAKKRADKEAALEHKLRMAELKKKLREHGKDASDLSESDIEREYAEFVRGRKK